MFTTSLTRAAWFIGLVLLQVLICNHIHVAGYGVPFPVIVYLLTLHSETPRWVYILHGFLLGLTVDVLSSTVGECAATLTLCGLLTPAIRDAFAPADRGDDGFTPSARTMKWGPYTRFATALSLLFVITFFLLETMSFGSPLTLVINIVASTAATLVAVLAIERIRHSADARP